MILFEGLLIGFLVAAPVGVVGLLCINRTLLQGSLNGSISGLGAATAHGIYGGIAGFGLTFITNFLVEEQLYIRIGGGVFLYCLGVKTFMRKPDRKKLEINHRNLMNSYLSLFLVAITNPLTILSFVAIFAGLELGNNSTNYNSAVTFVFGVFLGSTAWWLILSSGIGLLRNKVNSQLLKLINQISGIIILSFGFYST
ncbi:MAG: LysE family transporter [Cyanobacteria bacterium J06621_3]